MVLPCPCQQVENIAMALDSRCPICLDSWDNASYVLPCLHQFCFRCIQRWAESKPECPLCKGTISSIVHSLWADDKFKEVTITMSAEALDMGHPDDPGSQHPAGSRPQAVVGLLPGGLVGSFHPTTWAFIFRLYPQVLQPLLPWLHHKLEQLLGGDAQATSEAQHFVISSLRFFGLDEGSLALLLRTSLQRHTAGFVRQLIDTSVQQCSREVHHLLGLEEPRAAASSPSASPEGNSAPGPVPSRSPEAANVEELASTSAADALRGHPSRPLSVQEEPHEEQGEAVAGSSTASRGRDRSCRMPRQPPKSRASSSQDPLPPKKRPPRP